MTAISDDLLNVPTTTSVQIPCTITHQSTPQLQSESTPCQTVTPQPPPSSSVVFDTPTKSLLASLDQVLDQSAASGGAGAGNCDSSLGNGKAFAPPTATTM